MKAAGAWVFAAGLHPTETATVVRPAGPEIAHHDGPFIEAKEHLGGFTVIEAPDLDAALGWAGAGPRHHPSHRSAAHPALSGPVRELPRPNGEGTGGPLRENGGKPAADHRCRADIRMTAASLAPSMR